MKKDLEIVNIEDIDYAILKEVTYKNNIYLYLSNIDNPTDVFIRKSLVDNKLEVIPLENDDEFNLACALIFQKR